MPGCPCKNGGKKAKRESNIRKQAAAVILPTHGILVAGKDFLAAVDALERIDWNAWCILAQGLMPLLTLGAAAWS